MEVGNLDYTDFMFIDNESMYQYIDQSIEYQQTMPELNQSFDSNQVIEDDNSSMWLQDPSEINEENQSLLSMPEPINQSDEAIQSALLCFPEKIEDVDIKGSLVGKTAKTWEELYDLYKEHSNALGFSTKKGSAYKSKRTNKETERVFNCSCEGNSRAKEEEIHVPKPVQDGETLFPSPVIDDEPPKKKMRKKQTLIRRTGCLARMRVKYIAEDDLYVVANHILHHNHEMTRLAWNHFKRNERSISAEKAKKIQELEQAGVRAIDGFRVMANSVGGEENLGHTLKDHLNFVNHLRVKDIEEGDCQTLVDKLIKREADNKGFFYRIKFGEEIRLSAVFWRDNMMREDYELFGDVVSFDTTYRTNKYDLICAPIVGINNHWQTCMFGCAFIANETTETFVWLLEMFKLSMGGKEPKTIFTDQDHAMAKAIEQVFQGRTRNRLCLWHIQHNAVSHFGLLKTDEEFKKVFKHCLMGCSDANEFEQCWQSMLEEYNITEHSWFKRLYGLKDKWCTALSKDIFSAGILSSQRSESTNHAVGFKANNTTTLTRFFDMFTEVIRRWRSNEQQMEFRSESTRTRTSFHGGLVRHAAELYTPEIFKTFEKQVRASHATFHTVRYQKDSNDVLYDIAHEEIKPDKHEAVHFIRSGEDVTVECTCNHFNEVGWLCFHCIKVLDLNNVKRIPEKYIMERWTKDVKRLVWDREHQGRPNMTNVENEHKPWIQLMCRKYYDLFSACYDKDEARKHLENSFNRDALFIQQMFPTTNDAPATSEVSSTVESTRSAPIVRDPICSTTKGRKKKPPSKFQRKKPITDEFGSKTPNLHLL